MGIWGCTPADGDGPHDLFYLGEQMHHAYVAALYGIEFKQSGMRHRSGLGKFAKAYAAKHVWWCAEHMGKWIKEPKVIGKPEKRGGKVRLPRRFKVRWEKRLATEQDRKIAHLDDIWGRAGVTQITLEKLHCAPYAAVKQAVADMHTCLAYEPWTLRWKDKAELLRDGTKMAKAMEAIIKREDAAEAFRRKHGRARPRWPKGTRMVYTWKSWPKGKPPEPPRAFRRRKTRGGKAVFVYP